MGINKLVLRTIYIWQSQRLKFSEVLNISISIRHCFRPVMVHCIILEWMMDGVHWSVWKNQCIRQENYTLYAYLFRSHNYFSLKKSRSTTHFFFSLESYSWYNFFCSSFSLYWSLMISNLSLLWKYCEILLYRKGNTSKNIAM